MEKLDRLMWDSYKKIIKNPKKRISRIVPVEAPYAIDPQYFDVLRFLSGKSYCDIESEVLTSFVKLCGMELGPWTVNAYTHGIFDPHYGIPMQFYKVDYGEQRHVRAKIKECARKFLPKVIDELLENNIYGLSELKEEHLSTIVSIAIADDAIRLVPKGDSFFVDYGNDKDDLIRLIISRANTQDISRPFNVFTARYYHYTAVDKICHMNLYSFAVIQLYQLEKKTD